MRPLMPIRLMPQSVWGLDDITGSIEKGKSADLVVLDRDITELSPPDNIADTTILMTVLQGEIVFDSED